MHLFGGETLGIDGSFFKADASKDSIYTEDKLHQQRQQLEQKIKAYQEQLALQDEADNQAGLGATVLKIKLIWHNRGPIQNLFSP